MIDSILVATLSSATVAGIIVFFLKRYIDKWVSLEFDKRKLLFDKRLAISV